MKEQEEALTHYGVKGMKWGQRTDHSGPATVRVVQKKPGGKAVIKTAKGAGLKPSADALKVARYRQKAAKSGTQSLSNKDLQEVIKRMNLEQQYRKAQAPSGVRKFVAELILNSGKQQVQNIVNDRMGQLVNKALKK